LDSLRDFHDAVIQWIADRLNTDDEICSIPREKNQHSVASEKCYRHILIKDPANLQSLNSLGKMIKNSDLGRERKSQGSAYLLVF